MNATTLDAVVRRFPLLGRPRPACPSLVEQVEEVAGIAAAASGVDRLAEGAHALNKAALVLSDCGLHQEARDLCWRHINVYRQASTLSALQARYLLEPVINLARLQLRESNGDRALHLLEAVYQAVTKGSELVVDGHALPVGDLVGTREEHQKLREWVWLQYIGEGIRALTLSGRWDEAAMHAAEHRGIGLHLMEGRQVAIIAPLLHGDLHTARKLLEESTPAYPWERQVFSCLTVMCGDQTARRDMVERFHDTEPAPGYASFRARLGLAVVTLLGDDDPSETRHVFTRVIAEAIQAGDGYAARDVLGHRLRMSDLEREALSGLVTASGLGARAVPAPLLDLLLDSVKTAENALVAVIAEGARPGPSGC
ncbi:hypothetical protein [Herbidospora sp. RD11066]